MKLRLLILLFISNVIYSQSGIITYDVQMGVDLTTVPADKVDMISKMVNYSNNQKFELSFNKEKSCFKYIERLNSNPDFDPKMDVIAKLSFTSRDIYINHQIKSEIYIENDGNLVTKKYNDAKWEITKESKIIETYLCYKAFQKTTVIDRNGGKRDKEVIAWFAPILPYSFGPKNFYGLSGLILELTENKTTYLATKIALAEKEIVIDIPKGKTISNEEYQKKLRAQMGM